MNKWNIPISLEEEIKKRDKLCVYCHLRFKSDSFKKRATWEHIDNNAKNISISNIVLCCSSCNSSKGTKTLANWLKSSYCQKNGINENTIANVVKKSLTSK